MTAVLQVGLVIIHSSIVKKNNNYSKLIHVHVYIYYKLLMLI